MPDHFLAWLRPGSRLRLRAGLESEAPGAGWAICLHMGIHSLQRIRTLAWWGPALKYYNKHPWARDQGRLTPGLCHQTQKYLHHLTSLIMSLSSQDFSIIVTCHIMLSGSNQVDTTLKWEKCFIFSICLSPGGSGLHFLSSWMSWIDKHCVTWPRDTVTCACHIIWCYTSKLWSHHPGYLRLLWYQLNYTPTLPIIILGHIIILIKSEFNCSIIIELLWSSNISMMSSPSMPCAESQRRPEV